MPEPTSPATSPQTSHAREWDMTSVEDVIERALYNYPLMFAHRTEVLAHLFLSPGNGYEWTDGYLHSDYRTEEGDRTDEQIGLQYTPLNIPEDLIAILSEADKAAMHAIEADLRAKTDADNADLMAKRARAGELARTPGDPSRYLIHFPDNETPALAPPPDIRPDWDAARLELLAVVEPLWAAGVHILNRPDLTEDNLDAVLAFDAASPTPRITPEAADEIRAEVARRKDGTSTWTYPWLP
jgi:hypothetical protein